MSDQNEVVQLWEAPFFEQPAGPAIRPSLAELESLAQARGFETGREEGLASGQAEVQKVVGALTALVEQMAHPFRGLDEVVTRELAQIAMTLAEKIVRRELSIDSEVVIDIVAEAMSTLYKLEGDIVVFLNPADMKLIEESAPAILEGKAWKIVADQDLSPGGCQVKTATSFVDASVKNRIETVFDNLTANVEKISEN